MILVSLVMSGCLAGQVTNPSRYEPRQVPRTAPPAAIERDESAPAGNADAESEAARDPQEPPAGNGHRGAGRGAHGDTDLQLAPIEGGPRQKLRPPELLAQALAKPVEGALVGKPITLLAALSRVSDRQQQLKLVQAYWRLCAAQADYHWALDQRERLKHYTETHTKSPGVLSARAAARSDVLDALLTVEESQQELADALGGAADELPPLSIDRPPVGAYNTMYEVLFKDHVPPPRIRLIHRMLPVRRKAIDAHGEAILAALDALNSIGEEFKRDGHGLTTVLAALDQLKQERRAFMSVVRDYNQDTAEYALTVARPGADAKLLVRMLIETDNHAKASTGENRSRARAAEPPQDEPDQPREAAEPQESTSNYQPHNAGGPAEDPALYQGLADLEPARKAQKLASTLHWDRALPPDSGQPTSLGDCLRDVAPEQRLTVIGAYWRAREAAARYQAINDQMELLNSLQPLAISLRDHPGIAGAGVRLQASRQATRAAVLDAHARLLKTTFNLTQAAGRRLDDTWLLPSTPPQSGRYRVLAGVAPHESSPRAHHRARIVTLRHTKLQERADAIIEADAARVLLVHEVRQPADAKLALPDEPAEEPLALDRVVWAVNRQSRETLEFLEDLTDYNLAIARYALAVWPATTPSDQFVKLLVIARTANGET